MLGRAAGNDRGHAWCRRCLPSSPARRSPFQGTPCNARCATIAGLTTFIATQPAFHRSFCLRENLADISAKTQAQQMVVDNVGLAAAVGLNYACRHTGGALLGGGAGSREARRELLHGKRQAGGTR
jgi:hypothetical protein